MLDFAKKMHQVRERFRQLEAEMSNPAIFEERTRFQEVSREHTRLSELIAVYDRLEEVKSQVEENKEMLADDNDAEFTEMIKMELSSLEEEMPQLEQKMKLLIVPPSPADSKNCIIEIRPAAGGDESALFADDLMRMYINYAGAKGWKIEVLEHTSSDIGGLKSVSFMMKGENVYREMSFESGVHRVQRVPATESQGRVHTSTVTVAVMPEADEVDIELSDKDLRYDVFRSSGAGGQCVNTTDSAVRVTHIPTGIAVASQQERSQHRNKEIALQLLRSRLLEEKIREEEAKHADLRKGQIGTGDRSERIRTYNYPQNRVSDHRYNITLYDLPNIIQGELGALLNQILMIEAEQKLAAELS